jgi:hypothetical protein
MKLLASAVREIPDIGNLVMKFKENDRRIKTYSKYIRKNVIREFARDKTFTEQSKSYLRRYFNGYNDIRWHILYASLSGIKSPEYIPYDLWNTVIEPQLNPPDMARAYCDKNFYDKIFNYSHLPKTIARYYDNNFFDDRYNSISKEELIKNAGNYGDKIIMKPSLSSGGGRRVKIVKPDDLEVALNNIKQRGDWIFQEYVEQHPEVSRFHPPSINTVRIMTLNTNGEYKVLNSILRVGAHNNIVDNTYGGGLYIGNNSEGQLISFGLDLKLTKFDRHPNSGISFNKQKIPAYDKVIELVTYLHRFLYNFKVVSWDIAITRDAEPLILEYNLFNAGIGAQYCNGPLFGQYTDEALSLIKVPPYLNFVSSKVFGLKRRISYIRMIR